MFLFLHVYVVLMATDEIELESTTLKSQICYEIYAIINEHSYISEISNLLGKRLAAKVQ